MGHDAPARMTAPANEPPARAQQAADARATGCSTRSTFVCGRAGIAAPAVTAVIPEKIPLPYHALLRTHALLVHQGHPTLTARDGSPPIRGGATVLPTARVRPTIPHVRPGPR